MDRRFRSALVFPRVAGLAADCTSAGASGPSAEPSAAPSTVPGVLAVFVACLAVVALACSGGGLAQPGGSTQPGGGAGDGNAAGAPSSDVTATTPGPVPAGLVDPCTLLSTDAAAKIAGGTVLAGIRDPEEDGTYTQCTWRNDRAFLAGEMDFAPPLTVYLALRSEGYTQGLGYAGDLQATIGRGEMDVLPGTAAELAGIVAADLGTAGSSGAAGLKGGIYFRITCWSPQVPAGGQKTPSKAICSEAAKVVANALP